MKARLLEIQCSDFQVVKLTLVLLLFTEVHSTILSNCAYKSIGVEAKGIIPDSSFTASSHYGYFEARTARLENRIHGWGPLTNDTPNDYLQIDLGSVYTICAVATQGRYDYIAYTKTYKIMFSLDGHWPWTTYQENTQEKIFDGNTDGHSVVRRSLNKPLARYIRFIPISYHRWKMLRVGVYGYSKYEACITNPIRIQKRRAIPQSISSSRDSSPHLWFDLGSDHVICAVTFQGKSAAEQWEISYQVSTSSNAITWAPYKENNVTRVFHDGNYDRSTSTTRHVLYHSPITRYVGILRRTLVGDVSRIEIFGYKLQPGCSKYSVGIPSPVIVPNLRITASSYYDSSTKPYYGRLDFKGAWLTSTTKFKDFLQIDLGDTFYICAVLTQGNGYATNNWVTSYKIRYSVDNKLWTTYSEWAGVVKVFTGNTGRSTVVSNAIRYPFKAKFVRVLPIGYKAWKALRVDFKGTPQACSSPLGLENNKEILNSQMTSSSSSDNTHDAPHGRLYGSSAWCSSTTSNTEYIQVDLGQVKTVTGIATQGDPTQDKWVTSYYVTYSLTGRGWYEYREGEVTKVFTGNKNKNDVVVNWLSRPIAARYVKVLPQGNNGGHCLRFDLHGCDHFVTPKAFFTSPASTLPSTKDSSIKLSCTVIGEPPPDIQWFGNGTKIPGATRSTLQLKFISAEGVVSKYRCTRQDPDTRPVVCKTNYTCRVVYPVYDATTTVIVNLNIPTTLSFATFRNSSSLRLYWNSSEIISDDVGMITWYKIEFNNEGTITRFNVPYPTAVFDITGLKPSADYAVRMRAVSIVGYGLWSSWLNIKTSTVKDTEITESKSVAKPSFLPYIILLAIVASLSLFVNGYLCFRLYSRKKRTQNSQKPGDVTMNMAIDHNKKTAYGMTTEPAGQRNSAYVYMDLQHHISDNEIYETVAEPTI